MGKIAIVTDSNSGITQSQANELGVSVLPMPFMIEDETFYEDINLTQDEFYEKLREGANISTSQPSLEAVLNKWNELLKTYDSIVHIPMSSGLSGSYQSAHMLAEDFNGRVQVVNNQRISVSMRQSVLDAIALAERGKNAVEIRDILERDKFNSSIYIVLDTLFYLKKGGRITPAVAALGALLRLKPVLQIQGEKLDTYAKARTSVQGRSIMINAIRNDIINRFGGLENQKNISIQIAYTDNPETAQQFRKEIAEAFPEVEIYVDRLSLSVSCHIGPGALGVACIKKMKLD